MNLALISHFTFCEILQFWNIMRIECFAVEWSTGLFLTDRSDWLRSRSQRETCNEEMSEHTGLEQCGMESNENQRTRQDWTWLNLPGLDLRVWEWIDSRDCATVTLPLSLSEIVTSSRKWRPLECNQNYHRLEFDRNQHHMECDGNYCQTSGQKVCSKVWNVCTFPNCSDTKCFRLNIISEVQKCPSGWSGIDLWIAGVSGTTLMVEGHVTPLWPLAHSCHAKTYLD